MAIPEEYNTPLFPINSFATACNISRTTLLRFEDEGLITPAYRDLDTGYRYYDYESMSRVLNILKLQKLGFTKKEIIMLFEDPSKVSGSIDSLMNQYAARLQDLEDLIAVIHNSDDILIRPVHFRECDYFIRTREIEYTPENMKNFASLVQQEFIKKKIPGDLSRDMLVTIIDEDSANPSGQFDGKLHLCRVMIPTSYPSTGKDYIHMDACRALTITSHLDINNSKLLFDKLWNEAGEKKLIPVGRIEFVGFCDIMQNGNPIEGSNTLRLMLRTKS